MGAPIFVDDGGSIRLKLAFRQPNYSGKMEELFDVDETTHKSEFIRGYGNDRYDNVSLYWVDEEGILTEPDPPPSVFQKIWIYGDSKVDVEIAKEPGDRLSIRLIGDKVDPIVQSRQHRGKRSYSVTNAGRITQVDVEDENGNITAYPIPDTAISTNLVVT